MDRLIEKYNTAVPRYTSYPAVPFWDAEAPGQEQWKKIVKVKFDSSNLNEGIGVYIHLPFCESLCTYCGCNTRITVNHKVEGPYIEAVLKEWSMYLHLFETKPHIKEFHLGGGTPTFFNALRLKQLIEGISNTAVVCEDAVLSFEAHPNNTSDEHLKTFYQLGFRRVSLGIQDFDEDVQNIVNRIQSYESVKYVTEKAREIGYTSVNYDLIYGLPLQTERSIKKTFEKVIQLHPDRIAFYSYAHVPWLRPGQRKFTEADLPEGKAKRNLYESGRAAFEAAGYVEIGMDHFSLPQDPLYISKESGNLHRNFMGYTSHNTQLLIALGASAISDAFTGFVQNEKKVEDYYAKIEQGVFPFFKGHLLSEDDLIMRRHILNIICSGQTSWKEETNCCSEMQTVEERLKGFAKDELIELTVHALKVAPIGKPFIRNICAAFDSKFWAHQTDEKHVFSKAI
jgi:oxygen-independent coproporphyrinogen-3 oxidase